MDSLDELIQNGDMPPALALKILVQVRDSFMSAVAIELHSLSDGLPLDVDLALTVAQFDKANATTLVERVRSKWTARAGLQTYNLVEEVRGTLACCLCDHATNSYGCQSLMSTT